jgi:hypothetical protein
LKRKSKKAGLIVIFFTGILIITPMVAAATRKTYLTNYILANQDENNTFGNSYEETSFALEILNDYGLLSSVDTQSLILYLQNEMQKKFTENNMNNYDLYYLLNSLDLLITTGSLVNSSLGFMILNFLDGTNQTGGGFSYTNSSSIPNVISTYFAIQAYNIIDVNVSIGGLHKNWVLNCRNSYDGGYGGNASLPSSLISTYYAISILDALDATNEIEYMTFIYLSSFFISDINDQNNYGGFIPDEYAEYTLLSSTYYCIKSLTILSATDLIKGITCNWVYSLQNIKDGGFTDRGNEDVQKFSSIPSSYFAFKIITILGGNLNVQIWMVEFNWIILIVILSCIGVVIAVAIYFWRKRRI